jgi:hypothetical protein
MFYGGMMGAMGGDIGNPAAIFRERMQQGGMVPMQDPRLAGISFDINESAKNRKMRGMRKLSETGVGGEKDAAIEMIKKMGGPQLPPLAMNNPMLQMGNVAGMYGANV